MGFFYKHKPRKFNYIPRYYDPAKEEWEQKKAAAGLDSNLSHEEQLRAQMRSKWSAPQNEMSATEQHVRMIKRVTLGIFIAVLVYVLFCTPLLNNIVAGLMGGK